LFDFAFVAIRLVDIGRLLDVTMRIPIGLAMTMMTSLVES